MIESVRCTADEMRFKYCTPHLVIMVAYFSLLMARLVPKLRRRAIIGTLENAVLLAWVQGWSSQ